MYFTLYISHGIPNRQPNLETISARMVLIYLSETIRAFLRQYFGGWIIVIIVYGQSAGMTCIRHSHHNYRRYLIVSQRGNAQIRGDLYNLYAVGLLTICKLWLHLYSSRSLIFAWSVATECSFMCGEWRALYWLNCHLNRALFFFNLNLPLIHSKELLLYTAEISL